MQICRLRTADFVSELFLNQSFLSRNHYPPPALSARRFLLCRFTNIAARNAIKFLKSGHSILPKTTLRNPVLTAELCLRASCPRRPSSWKAAAGMSPITATARASRTKRPRTSPLRVRPRPRAAVPPVPPKARLRPRRLPLRPPRLRARRPPNSRWNPGGRPVEAPMSCSHLPPASVTACLTIRAGHQ